MVTFRITGHYATKLREVAPKKAIPANILSWSEEALSSFFGAMIAGDGYVRAEDRRSGFIQKDKRTADMVQAVAFRLGYSTKLSWRHNSWCLYLTRKPCISLRGTTGSKGKVGIEKYSGVVWCPNLPMGTWIARKDGRAFITGNTFPPELPETCIKAGTSQKGCCPKCGVPWERVTEQGEVIATGGKSSRYFDARMDGRQLRDTDHSMKATEKRTKGWQPTCECGERETVSCTVLDPFAGSGTTGEVARSLGRSSILIELNPLYIKLLKDRTEADVKSLESFSEKSAGTKGVTEPPNVPDVTLSRSSVPEGVKSNSKP